MRYTILALVAVTQMQRIDRNSHLMCYITTVVAFVDIAFPVLNSWP